MSTIPYGALVLTNHRRDQGEGIQEESQVARHLHHGPCKEKMEEDCERLGEVGHLALCY